VVHALRNPSSIFNESGQIAEDILSIGPSFEHLSFQFSPRCTNQVTHVPIKMAASLDAVCFWLKDKSVSLDSLPNSKKKKKKIVIGGS
jgi:hypothetical protein